MIPTAANARPAANPNVSLRRSRYPWIRGGSYFTLVCGLTSDDRSVLPWENDGRRLRTMVDGIEISTSLVGGGHSEIHTVLRLGKGHTAPIMRFRCASSSDSKLAGAEAMLASITAQRWAEIIAQ